MYTVLGGTISYAYWQLNSARPVALDSPYQNTVQHSAPRLKPASETSHSQTQPPDQQPRDDPNLASVSEPVSESQIDEASSATEESAAEESSGAAYNPETGEINWDCPCLGGMAHGPCGPEFREAFSCFVHSEDEPKGINCVEKFTAMQTCFRAHPEVYGAELDDEDEESSSESTEDQKKPDPLASDTAVESKAKIDEPQKEKSSSEAQP